MVNGAASRIRGFRIRRRDKLRSFPSFTKWHPALCIHPAQVPPLRTGTPSRLIIPASPLHLAPRAAGRRYPLSVYVHLPCATVVVESLREVVMQATSTGLNIG
ncbi:hypothetical protein BDZ89DRAFT_838048 [Hymenopellis radicata]|nr:hypothetical protein BDZ89DRAFT_838048 [Hymenopellis radicata]